jgi:hypothetical protein
MPFSAPHKILTSANGEPQFRKCLGRELQTNKYFFSRGSLAIAFNYLLSVMALMRQQPYCATDRDAAIVKPELNTDRNLRRPMRLARRLFAQSSTWEESTRSTAQRTLRKTDSRPYEIPLRPQGPLRYLLLRDQDFPFLLLICRKAYTPFVFKALRNSALARHRRQASC